MSRSSLASLALIALGCGPPSAHPAPGRPSGPPGAAILGDAHLPADAEAAAVADEVEPEDEPAAPPAPERPPHPLAGLGDAELEALLERDPAALGSASLGRPSAGALFGAVAMPPGDFWQIVNPPESWGTQETVDFIARAITRVAEEHPGSARLHVGDISARAGGHLEPHISHQSGRDVDLGFYYTTPGRWYMAANAANLDLDRTWALIRALVIETDVQLILVDRKLLALLRAHAERIGEDPAWLDSLFGGPTSTTWPILRHADGHGTHLHVRFYNPVAQETGRRLYPALIARKQIEPPTTFLSYRARAGDNLHRIAKKYGTTVRALQKANGLRSTRIYARRVYKIPRAGGIGPPSTAPLAIPPRRLPPPRRPTAPAAAVAPPAADA